MEYKKIFNADKPDLMDSHYNIHLPISSVCGAKCKFCVNEQNPIPAIRAGFRPLHEIKDQLKTYDKFINHSGFVLLGGVVLGYERNGFSVFNNRTSKLICFGEPTIHPNFFEILDIIRCSNRNIKIRFFTNGMKLTEEFVKKLSTYNPIDIILSFGVSIDKDIWMDHYSSNIDDYNIVINAIDVLRKYNINVIPNLLIGTHIEDLEKSLKYISNKNIKSILIENVGYTAYTSTDYINSLNGTELSKEELKTLCTKYNLHNQSEEYRYNCRPDLIFKKIQEFDKDNKKSYWFTSIAGYDVVLNTIEDIKNKYSFTCDTEIIVLNNLSYGDMITCAGLFLIRDIKDKIESLGLVNENIILPSIFLDDYGFDLSGENIQDYFKISKNRITLIHNKEL